MTHKMLRSLLLLAVAIRAAVSAPWQDNPDTCGMQGPVPDFSVQIAGGHDAENYGWPWMAAMYKNDSFICGASVIDPYWVITAAHCCIDQHPENYTFRVGSINRTETTPFTQIRIASEKFIHPEYNIIGTDKNITVNDIALIKIKTPFHLSKDHKVNSVCLPTKDMGDEFKVGQNVTATGWGSITKTEGDPKILQQVDLPIFNDTACNKTYKSLITKNMICAGTINNPKGSCTGDSGGPLVGFGKSNQKQYHLIGIVSFGPKTCGDPIKKPGVYTRVSEYEEWIKTTMNKTDATKSTFTEATTQSNTRSTVQPTTSSITQPTTNVTTHLTPNATTQPTTNLTTKPTTNLTSKPTTNATTQPTTNATTNATSQPTTNTTTHPTTNAITNLTTSSPTPSPGRKTMDNKTLIIIILVLAGAVIVLIIIIKFCSGKHEILFPNDDVSVQPGSCERDSKTEGASKKKSTISICTSAEKDSVDGFINELRKHLGEDQPVEYMELPYNNLEDFDIKKHGIEVMILCHSIHNRRFSITDVADSLYDTFLKNAATTLGKERVGVIVHDFPTEKFDSKDIYDIQLDAFKIKQPTTFEKASLVLIAGRLNGTPVQLPGCGWPNINSFVNKWNKK